MKLALIACNTERQGFPPMGIMYLSSYIKRNISDVNITLYDVFPDMETLVNENYDMIGLSVLSIQYYEAEKFAIVLRERFHGIILLGGIHVTLTTKLPSWADIAMLGEGEQTFLELIKCLLMNDLKITDDLDRVDGLLYRKNQEIRKTAARKIIENLDIIPFPDRESVGIDNYLKTNNVFGTVVGRGLTVMTSRGCPYNCEYCSSSTMWGNIRFNSAEYVVNELEHIVKTYDTTKLWVIDDNFGVNETRLKKMVVDMERRNLQVELGISGRIESYNDNMAELYKRVGVKAIAFGLETGSDRMLKKIKNRSTKSVAEAADTVRKAAADGFEIHGMFMMNMPGETLEDIEATIRLIHELPLAKCTTTIATPYIGTKWWDIALEQGIVPKDPDSLFWDTYNIKEYIEGRPLFINGIDQDKLLEIYKEIQAYQRSLFFFDWHNRD